VSQGQAQGSIASDVDPQLVAWLIAGWAWTGDVAHLMGVRPIWHPAVSAHLLDLILGSISARPDRHADPSEISPQRLQVEVGVRPDGAGES